MNKITFPLNLQVQGPEVADLHEALVFLGFAIAKPEQTNQRFGPSTQAAVSKFQTAQKLPATGEVDAATADTLNAVLADLGAFDPAPGGDNDPPVPDIPPETPRLFTVQGEVVKPDGTPLQNLVIRAYDRALCEWRRLGNVDAVVRTNDYGRYRLTYDPTQLKAWGKTRADLKVQVFDQTGDEELAASPLILQALPREEVNFSIGKDSYRGPDEYTRVEEALLPLLESRDDLSCIGVADVLILARDSGQAPTNVAYYIKARIWSAALDLPSVVFYGLLRESGNTQKSGLFAQSLSVLWKSLESAVALNIINIPLDEALRTRLSKVQQAYLNDPKQPYTTLLQTTGLGPEQRNVFTRLLTSGMYTGEEFWQALDMEAGFTRPQIQDLQETFELQSITGNTSLAIHLRGALDVHQPQQIAAFSVDQWEQVVAAEDIDIPDDVLPGEADDVRQKMYAQALYHYAEIRFPTPSLTGQMSRSTTWANPDLFRFLEDRPGFEFDEERITLILARQPDVLDEFPDPDLVRTDLLRLEQLFHLTEHSNKLVAVEALWNGGLRSAPQIAAAGRQHLLRQVPDVDGHAVKRIYRKAVHMTSFALNLYISNHPGVNRLTTNALRGRQVSQEQELARAATSLPEWDELFGSADACECTPCQSALSPAAYQVNILDYLQRATDEDGNNALDELLSRRPDLGMLQLTCENTDTELPKIDLLVEIMEEIVAHSTDGRTIPATGFGQTTWDSDLLAAQPERMVPKAYETLRAAAVHPFDLPFDLWLVESRRYLQQMGVAREQLMQVMPRQPGVGATEIAMETLGMGIREHAIIRVPDTRPDKLAEYWGIDLARGPLPIQLGRVQKLLKQANIDYDSLLLLLNTRYVNPAEPNGKISVSFGDTACSLDEAELVDGNGDPLGAVTIRPFLDRLHRFLRLQRRLDPCTVYELDSLLAALGFEEFNQPGLVVQLARVQTLRQALGLPITELCSWWAPLSTFTYEEDLASQYESIFQNPAVFPDTAAGSGTDLRNDVFALTGDRSDLVITQSTTLNPWLAQWDATTETYELDSGYAAYIQSATRLTSADIALLVAEALPKGTDNHVALNLANVSLLYRIGSFTRALKISIADYLRLEQLTGIAALTTPDQIVSPLDSSRVRDIFVEIDSNQWSLEQLAYLLLHEMEAAAAFGPNVEDMDALRDELSVAFEGIANSGAADPFEAARQDVEVKAALTQSLGNSLGLDAELLDDLLFVHRSGIGDDLIINLMLALDQVPTGLPTPAHDFYHAYETLHKFSFAWNPMGLDASHLAFVLEQGAGMGWTDITALPLEGIDTADLDSWRHLTRAADLQESLFSVEQALFVLLGAALEARDFPADGMTREAFLAQASEWTLWNSGDVTYLTGPAGFDYTYPNDFCDAQWLDALDAVFAVQRRLGVSAAQAHTWARAKLDFVESDSIKQALTLAYDPNRWLEVMASIQDDLRILKRNALLGYLWGNLGTKHSTDFYNYYLVDPEVDPCLKTSRMVEAHAAVQLFAQRILLNLEGTFKFAPEDAEGWQWRKNYRVWEAASKIFLYPENWMEPEWRDDKSPFFKELEDGLLQDDVTQQSAERLYREYLYKLDQVSRLEIMGIYEDIDETSETNTLHVFGRTKGVPHLYYYRRRENQSRWTPWEKVDLDINVDHLIPIVYNGRLYLFWPEFTVKQIEPPIAELEKEIEELNEQIELLNSSISDVTAQIADLVDENRALFEPILNTQLKVLEIQRDSKIGEKEIKLGRVYEIIATHLDLRIELRMAWSQYDGYRWSAKTMTKQDQTYIYDTDYRSAKHYFTGWVTRTNELRLAVHTITLTQEQFTFDAVRTPVGYFHFDKCGTDLLFNNSEPDAPRGEVYLHDSYQYYHHWHIIYKDSVSLEIDGTDQTNVRELLNTVPSTVPPNDINLYYAHQYGLGGSETSPFFLALGLERTYFVQPLPNVAVVPDHVSYDYSGLKAGSSHISFRQEPPSPTLALSREMEPLNTATHYDNSSSGQIIDHSPLGSSLGSMGDLTQVILDTLGKDEVVIARLGQLPTEFLYRFERFYHPYTCLFLKQLSRYGIEGLLNPDPDWDDDSRNLYRQLTPLEEFDFEATYEPVSDWVMKNYTSEVLDEKIDFDHDSAYGLYNWELFFHIPLTIATRLMGNQRFDEALRWFHYIFNPTSTDGGGPERFWKIKPFYEEQLNGPIETLSELIDLLEDQRDQMENQVEAWEKEPFSPFVIGRLRTAAFMKTTVMKYLDCLIAKADMLFTMGTREFVNEAAQYYMLAAEILGEKPILLPEQEPKAYTPNQLLGRATVSLPLPPIPRNPLEALTSVFPAMRQGASSSRTSAPIILGNSTTPSQGAIGAYDTLWLFCLPHNEMLYGYWDTVADRVFKIRHCMNIQGQVSQLPLFAPSIDPALLVRATAAGLDISSIISGLYASLPNYRFSFMFQKALEICGEVRNFGSSLLAALEKKDGEELSLLRSTHEVSLLQEIRELKQKSIEEAESSLGSLAKSKESAEFRRDYYSSLEQVSAGEQKSLDKQEDSRHRQKDAEIAETMASILHPIPTFSWGNSGPFPTLELGFGGPHLGAAAQSFASYFRARSAYFAFEANKAGTMAGYDRRLRDWLFQADLAKKEIEQLDKQILAAEIRKQITENDLSNHEQQIAQAEEVEEFLKMKFSNQQLYSWMVSKLSTLYFQSYQMALQMAKQAERTFQHELGPDESSLSFVQPTYWDSLKKGLLAGEQLGHDLRRMESAHLEKNRRELEITKHISLFQLDPSELLTLRETGSCDIHIPEVLFDMDFAGHYFRRIKSARISIPCVVGPYTNVSGTLSLMESWTRRNANLVDTAQPDRDTTVFPQTAIATSSANQDGGVFELSFSDPRYLPFEGAGAVSSWRLELPSAVRAFDYDTITDVILHLSYSARDGGATIQDDGITSFKEAVTDGLTTALNDLKVLLEQPDVTLSRLFSLRQEFGAEWNRLLFPGEGQPQTLTLNLTKRYFPKYLDYVWQDSSAAPIALVVDSLTVFLNPALDHPIDAAGVVFKVNDSTASDSDPPGLIEFEATSGLSGNTIDNLAGLSLTLTINDGALLPEAWKDMYALVNYRVNVGG